MYFDPNEQHQSTNFDPIPNGEYTAVVEEVSQKYSKAGNAYVSVVLNITDPKFSGRKIFENYNLFHEKETASRIARAQFAELCKSVNAPKIENETELVRLAGKPLRVKLKTIKNNFSGEMENKVKGCMPISQPVQQNPYQQQPQQQMQPQQQDQWKRHPENYPPRQEQPVAPPASVDDLPF